MTTPDAGEILEKGIAAVHERVQNWEGAKPNPTEGEVIEFDTGSSER